MHENCKCHAGVAALYVGENWRATVSPTVIRLGATGGAFYRRLPPKGCLRKYVAGATVATREEIERFHSPYRKSDACRARPAQFLDHGYTLKGRNPVSRRVPASATVLGSASTVLTQHDGECMPRFSR